MTIKAETFDGLYKDVLGRVLNEGAISSPRGMETKELIGVQLRLSNPTFNILSNDVRKINHRFAIGEWLWILFGQNDVNSISRINSQIVKFSDDGARLDGAYGPRVSDQLSYVIDTLGKDPSSRQAVINIWRERPRASRDVPCTLSLQFLLRDKRLTLVTTMRSNDVYLGLPYDLFTFTQLQMYVAACLDVHVGEYVHNVGSFHLYESNYEAAEKCLNAAISYPKSLGVFNTNEAIVGQVRTAFNAIPSFLAQDPGTFGEAVMWLIINTPEPWQSYLQVIASRWIPELQIRQPYKHLIR